MLHTDSASNILLFENVELKAKNLAKHCASFAINDWNHTPWIRSWNCCITPYIRRIDFYLVCPLSIFNSTLSDWNRHTTGQPLKFSLCLTRNIAFYILQNHANKISRCVHFYLQQNCAQLCGTGISHSFFWILIQYQANCATISLFRWIF